jgi:hypothetical protein
VISEVFTIKEVAPAEDFAGPTLRALHARFSTGLRLPELRSIAAIICHLVGIARPSRDMHRSYPLMVKWFAENWAEVSPCLNVVQLMDAEERAIDGSREMAEMRIFFEV